MNNDKSNRPEDIRELSLEEMEDVNGGGIREIVAGVTLAAMTMTGGAFGMAGALAEDSGAYVETVPAAALEGPVEEVFMELGGEEPAPQEVMAAPLDEEIPEVTDAVEADMGRTSRSIEVGDTVIIDTGTSGNAGVWKKWDYIDGKKASYSLPSGTAATLIKASKYHSGKGRNYAMIEFTYKGKTCQGWIAASIIGLPR